ncbi:MAG: hypothetical protein FK733_13880 [Asgard group archaeon]|nr:hypothetical protein [Asgard group archaeon]
MKRRKQEIVISIFLIVLVSYIQIFIVRDLNAVSFSKNLDVSFADENSQDSLENIGFDLENIEYSPIPPDAHSVNESILDNNFDYVDHTILKGNYYDLNGNGTSWSENPYDGDILELVVGDSTPFTIDFIGHYKTMEAKLELVSNTAFVKQNDPGINGEIIWRWDVNANEQGLLSNIYYSFGTMKVTSGSGYSVDSYIVGDNLNVYATGDPATRLGTTEIPNFDSIIDPDGKIRIEVQVYAKGFVDWWYIFTKDAYIDIEVHGLAVRQDLVPRFIFENNFDYSSYEIIEGDYYGMSGSSSAWSEDPDDSTTLYLNVNDDTPYQDGILFWRYYEQAKLNLVSHNTFTKLNDTTKDGTISWKWDVEEHGQGNGYNLHYSTGSIAITSGNGLMVDTYTQGSSDVNDNGDPDIREGSAAIQNFDSIIDPDGRIRLTVLVDADGKVDWLGVETKMLWIRIRLYGLSIKQNVRVTHLFDNNFDYEASEYSTGSETRGLYGVGSAWSENFFDGSKLEYAVGDTAFVTSGYDLLFEMGGTLHVKSHNTFQKQKEDSFDGLISWAFDVNGHEEVSETANLYYSFGGLYILKSTGEPVLLDEWSTGSDIDYAGEGDPSARVGTTTLDNFDQYIWNDGHLYLYLTCYAEGWISWWGVETKDIWIDIEFWGLSVTQEIHPPDDTPPEIYILYLYGDETDGNPGYWFVYAIDEESGINNSSIQVFIDDVFVGTGLGGYLVPNTLGTHTIRVELLNNHPINPLGDVEEHSVDIIDDDTTHPNIIITYWGSGTDGYPGYFNWSITDLDDDVGGDQDNTMSELTIIASYNTTDGSDNYTTFLAPDLNGTWILDSNLGNYKLEIYVRDGDDDRTLINDSLSTYIIETQFIADDDILPPEISINYENGDGTDGNPGYFEWNITDAMSAVGQHTITIEYDSTDGSDDFIVVYHDNKTGVWYLPSNLGTYSISISAHDADLDRGFKDTSATSASLDQEIVDDDFIPPDISNLEAIADSDFVNITFTAQDSSGLGIIELYVDSILVEVDYLVIQGHNYNVGIINQWSHNNDTHDVLVVVYDADNDRISDASSTSDITTFYYEAETTTATGISYGMILITLICTMLIINRVATKKKRNNKG